jgi:hypothetical protein
MEQRWIGQYSAQTATTNNDGATVVPTPSGPQENGRAVKPGIDRTEHRGRSRKYRTGAGKNLLAVVLSAVVSLTFSLGEIKAEETASPTGWLGEWNLTLGVSAKEQRIHVKESFWGDEYGTLSSGFQPTVLVDIGSPYRYFGGSDFGWYVLYAFRHFNADTQLVGDDKNSQDLGTSAKGYMMYLTPMIFWGPAKEIDATAVKIGAGAGIGYVNASGDVIFTETDDMERHHIDISDAAFTVGLSMEAIRKSFLVRIAAGIGMVNKGGLYYEVPDIAIELGYVF